MLLSSVVQLTRPDPGRVQGIVRFLDRRRGYAPVVAGKGLAVAYGEVDAPRILECLVRFIGPFGNRACARLAKGVPT